MIRAAATLRRSVGLKIGGRYCPQGVSSGQPRPESLRIGCCSVKFCIPFFLPVVGMEWRVYALYGIPVGSRSG